jgi:predicted methyltransferase
MRLAAFTAALFATTLICAPAMAQRVSPAIAAAVADAGRPDTDKERDANRKPAETVAFAGVRPGMVVAELGPGRGYYTRILAKAVGPKGKVYAVLTTAQAARPGVLDAMNALVASYPNVKLVTVDYATDTTGTATSGVDFQPTAGTVTFAIGETSKPVTVLINGDTTPEPNETFGVKLSNNTGVGIGDFSGAGTILDDDGPGNSRGWS